MELVLEAKYHFWELKNQNLKSPVMIMNILYY